MSTENTNDPTLRELVNDAMAQISTYKHPNIDEAKARLNEVLVAADLGGIAGEWVEDMNEYGGSLHIETKWSARGCTNDSQYALPSFIIDATDPLAAAKEYGLNQKVAAAQRRVQTARTELQRAEQVLSEAQAVRAAFTAPATSVATPA